jgi:hypothetical protein
VRLPLRPLVSRVLFALLCLGTRFDLPCAGGPSLSRPTICGRFSQSKVCSVPCVWHPAMPNSPTCSASVFLLLTRMITSAIAYLRQAVALNPNSGRYWLDLASVYQVTGNVEKKMRLCSLLSTPNRESGSLYGGRTIFLVAGDVRRACRCSGKLSCRTRKLPRPFSRCAGARRGTRICFLLR